MRSDGVRIGQRLSRNRLRGEFLPLFTVNCVAPKPTQPTQSHTNRQ